MPTVGANIGLNTTWFPEALATASEVEIAHTRLRLISPIAFIATKYVAFLDRGKSDYYASHDLEDLVTVIDGRADFVRELEDAPSDLRDFVMTAIKALWETSSFQEALSGHLPADFASQARLPDLRGKLRAMATG